MSTVLRISAAPRTDVERGEEGPNGKINGAREDGGGILAGGNGAHFLSLLGPQVSQPGESHEHVEEAQGAPSSLIVVCAGFGAGFGNV